MAHVLWTPTAERELEEVVYYIGVEAGRPVTAQRIAEQISDHANKLAQNPTLGHRHPDFPEGWLYSLFKRWLVLYQEYDEGIEILRLVDATRDLRHIIKT
jgi:toxin ParE1/3/4